MGDATSVIRGSTAAAGGFRELVEHRQHVGGAPPARERPSSYPRPIHVNGTTKLKCPGVLT